MASCAEGKMAEYVKWDCAGIGSGSSELRESMVRLATLTDELRSLHRQLDPQLADYEGIGRTLRAHIDSAEGDVQRMRSAYNALEGVLAVYTGAERKAMQASESLPTGIAERGLIFEEWFSDLLR